MRETVWIPDQYTSQFGLLGVMARELRDAFEACGHDARIISIDEMREIRTGVLIFMNTPTSIDMLPPALFDSESGVRAIQYLVDHPFTLPDEIIDEWSGRAGLDNYRLCLPCADDAHLLRARYPGLVHRWVPHGIPPDALCDAKGLTPRSYSAREFDVVVTGSVRTREEIEAQLIRLPGELGAMAKDIVHLMLSDPHLGYLAAADLVMGTRGAITGDWKTLRMLWGLVIAIVNRERRTRAVQALQGLRVGVFGSEAWAPACTGTISYMGEVEYARNAEVFARGRVALAWGPTQFVHSYSERIMQAMGGGAAVVADDRLLARRDFKDACLLFDWSQPNHAREAIERVLGDADAGLAMAQRGRDHVETYCLWTQRIQTMLSI